MGRGKVVVAPDGERWLVRRRWLDRPLPSLRGRFRRNRDDGAGEGVLEGLAVAPDVADSWASIGLAVAVLLIVFVLLPLLGVALELIAVLVLLLASLAGRLFLGRPWIVEAVTKDGGGRSSRFPVKGWREAGGWPTSWRGRSRWMGGRRTGGCRGRKGRDGEGTAKGRGHLVAARAG